MEFVTDKQTLEDLNMLGRYKSNSIFSLFNHTTTSGGMRLLEKMFKNPFTNKESINERKDILSFFSGLNISLPFEQEEFEIVENYLRNSESKNRLLATVNITRLKLLNIIASEKDYEIYYQGLRTSIELFFRMKKLVEEIAGKAKGTAYETKAHKLLGFLEHKDLKNSYETISKEKLNFAEVLNHDFVYRAQLNDSIEEFLNEIYELDVFITVSKVGNERGFVYANALDKKEKIVEMNGVYHPCIPAAIDNDITIDGEKNVFFLTGANMAGKSTFMKSFSIAIYLAHMGFPLAVKEMNFSVHEGIYTSINVPDDLAKGYSHFYAEVLRVKHVAEEVASNKQLVIIFDELFKGTNVKDAYDGTVSIIDAFSKRNGTFIVSTHIMEAGTTLQENNERMFFKYLPTVMEGKVPRYTYKLTDGITDDRHGMIIIQNERILETIKGNIKSH